MHLDGFNAIESELTEQPQRNKGGRPKGSTKLTLDEDTLKQINNLARIQCTRREAAAVLGVHPDTFAAFLHAHPEAMIAWEDGPEQGKASLRRAQFKSMQDGNVSMQIWLGKQWLDQKDKSDQQLSGPNGGPIQSEQRVLYVNGVKPENNAS